MNFLFFFFCSLRYFLHVVFIISPKQQVAQRHPIQNPDPAVLCAAPAESGLPGGRLAGALPRRRGPLHFHCLVPSLLLVSCLHMDGSRGRPHVRGTCESLQRQCIALHAEVLAGWMGYPDDRGHYCHCN